MFFFCIFVSLMWSGDVLDPNHKKKSFCFVVSRPFWGLCCHDMIFVSDCCLKLCSGILFRKR